MALALMRRHRRWLYIFLWLVIAAFIILYIPAFQKGEQAGTPGETVVSVGGLPVSVGEFQQAYSRQRQVYERMYQGRLNEATLRQLGLEQQVLDSLVGDRLVELEKFQRLTVGRELNKAVTARWPDDGSAAPGFHMPLMG